MKRSSLTLLCVLTYYYGFSQDSLIIKETELSKKFNFSGYIDSYYLSNFNNPASRDNLGQSGTARAFDQKAATFSLGLVQTKFTYSPDEKSDVVVDLVFGPNADLGNYGNAIGPLGGVSTSLAIKQAYFNWKPFKKLTLTAGQFGTHIGYEVIDAPINFNYSLSNLFNNGPFYHIGLKAQYAFTESISLMAGVVNNVDALYDNNRPKGLICQLALIPKTGWNIYLNGIASNEASADSNNISPYGQYLLGDLTTTYQLSEKFLLGLNAAYGRLNGAPRTVEENNTSKPWGGVALYGNFAFTSKFSLGSRYEYFDNQSGARGLRISPTEGITMNSATLTATFTAANSHLLIKPELRVDIADEAFFNGTTSNEYPLPSQTTLGLAMIYKY